MKDLTLEPRQCVRMNYVKGKGYKPCTRPCDDCELTKGWVVLRVLLCDKHQDKMRSMGYTVTNKSRIHSVTEDT